MFCGGRGSQLHGGNAVLSSRLGLWWEVDAALQSIVGEDIGVSWNVVGGGLRSVCQQGQSPKSDLIKKKQKKGLGI